MKNRIITEQNIALLINVLCICFMALLFCFSLSVTGYTIPDYTQEYPYLEKDSIIGNIFWLMSSFFFIAFIVFLYKKYRSKINLDIVAIVVCVVYMGISAIWIVSVKNIPIADQGQLCLFASAFNRGEYEGLQKGEYMAIYTQQFGVVTFIRILFKIFGDGNYKAFQAFTVMTLSVLIYSGYSIVKRIKGNTDADLIYLIIVVCCIPLYIYTPFIYGDIVSTAFIVCACAVILKYVDNYSLPKAIVAGGLTALAILFRKNVLIFLIAIMIVIFIKFIFGKRKEMFILAVSIVGIVVLSQYGINKIYASHIPYDSHPSPAILHIAMGTNFDGIMPGAYNNYVYDIYSKCDFNPDMAKQEGYETLREFVQKCQDEKGYFSKFCYYKFTQQWCSPLFQATMMVRSVVPDAAGSIAQKVYQTDVHRKMEEILNIYQLLIYGGVLASLLLHIKKWNGIENYILLIAVFGGAIFSMIWEAKPRYVFPYFLAMLPYAAVGIGKTVDMLLNIVAKTMKKYR